MILRNVFLIAAVILMANCGGLKCSQSTDEDNCLGEQSLAVYKTNGHSCVWLNEACKDSSEHKDILRAKKNASYEKAKADGQKAPENLKKACKDFVQELINYMIIENQSKNVHFTSIPTDQEIENQALACAGDFYGECDLEDIKKSTALLKTGIEFYRNDKNKDKRFNGKTPQYSSEKCKIFEN